MLLIISWILLTVNTMCKGYKGVEHVAYKVYLILLVIDYNKFHLCFSVYFLTIEEMYTNVPVHKVKR